MINVRRKAYDLFRAIVRDGGYSNLVLASGLNDDIYVTDRGFITALVYGTIDKLINLDYVLALFTKGRVQPKIQDILRLSAYQLLYMDVADYTICNEAVNLTNAIGKAPLKGFVNGVLRNLARGRETITYPNAQLEPLKYLSVKYSYPEFLVEDLLQECCFSQAETRLSYTLQPSITVRANPKQISSIAFKTELERKKFAPKPGLLYNDVFSINGNRIFKDTLFENGYCSTQSEPSMLVCDVMDPAACERILDCCAAPGGKTVCMAERMSSGQIIACDVHKHRCDLIFSNVQRCKVRDIVEVKQLDATVYDATLGQFDKVLVDAPCSGLGVVSTKPDIKLTLRKQGLAEIENTQKQILDCAAYYVRSGGMLVYSTCTVRRAENTDIVNAFLQKHTDFIVEPIGLPSGLQDACTPDGYIQLYPHKHNLEGFFIARLRKK